MKRILNKKSIFFSIFSIFIILIFYLSLKLTSEQQRQENEMSITRVRVSLLNNIVNDFENRYLEQMLYVAAKSAIGSMSKYASTNLGPCSSVYRNCVTGNFNGYKYLEKEFNSTMSEGKLYDTSNGVIDFTEINYINNEYELDKTNLNYIINELKKQFDTLGLEVKQLDVTITSIRQDTPWTIHFGADINYYFVDKDKIASWAGLTHKEIELSIIGMYDPISSQKITSSFVVDKYENCNFFPGTDCVVVNGLFCNNFNSPSFVSKLKGIVGVTSNDIDEIGKSICYNPIVNCEPICT